MRTLPSLALLALLGTQACTGSSEDTDGEADPIVDTDDTDAVADACQACHQDEHELRATVDEDTDTEPVDEGES